MGTVSSVAARRQGWWRGSTTWLGRQLPGESEQRLKQPGCLDRSATRQPATIVKWSRKYDSSTEKGSTHAGMKVLGSLLRVCYSGAPHARGPARLAVLGELERKTQLPHLQAHMHLQTSSAPRCCVSRFRAPPRPQAGQAGQWRGYAVCPGRPSAMPSEPPARRPMPLPPHSRLSCEPF